MFSLTKKTLLALAGVAAFAAGGATLAGAATKSTASRPPHPAQTQLTGDTAAKVKAAAEAKVPGGTVLRVEQGGPDGSAYHAHVRKADGSEVVVLVNASFEATSVAEPLHR
jgi:predicted enzyme related to lactoylglutathione lyase